MAGFSSICDSAIHIIRYFNIQFNTCVYILKLLTHPSLSPFLERKGESARKMDVRRALTSAHPFFDILSSIRHLRQVVRGTVGGYMKTFFLTHLQKVLEKGYNNVVQPPDECEPGRRMI